MPGEPYRTTTGMRGNELIAIIISTKGGRDNSAGDMIHVGDGKKGVGDEGTGAAYDPHDRWTRVGPDASHRDNASRAALGRGDVAPDAATRQPGRAAAQA